MDASGVESVRGNYSFAAWLFGTTTCAERSGAGSEQQVPRLRKIIRFAHDLSALGMTNLSAICRAEEHLVSCGVLLHPDLNVLVLQSLGGTAKAVPFPSNIETASR
jgi:hypothetical protein